MDLPPQDEVEADEREDAILTKLDLNNRIQVALLAHDAGLTS